MMDENSITGLVSQYEKHGWQLRLVLRSPAAAAIPSLLTRMNGVVIRESELDALWFSRPNGGKESWELRRIGGSPYALVRFVEMSDHESLRDEILRSAESEMLSAKPEHRGN